MSKNVRLSILLVALFASAVTVALVLSGGGTGGAAAGAQPAPASSASSSAGSEAGPVVREDSHRLSTAPDGQVTLVEFLDFECEACLAAYPVVEDLREEYEGRVTFVVRYFPVTSHTNAVNSALAVEAAAQQGEFEAMYQRMYQTQTEWGEQQTSRADLFRSFAVDLGLDMEAYDAAVADPATLARVDQDFQDGIALGVQGTPTFFLNGEKLEPASVEAFKASIDAALKD